MVGEGGLRATIVRRVWFWSRKGAMTVIEQGVFSGSNFIFNILLIRWMSPEQYGAFALSYAAYLFALQIYTSLMLDPLGVLGSARHADDLRAYFRAQLRLHAPLSIALGGGIGIGMMLLNPAVPAVALAVSIPFMLLPWLLRRVFYVDLRPEIALLGSVCYGGLLLAMVYWIRKVHWLHPGPTLLAMALAGGGAALGMGVFLPSAQKQRLPWRALWSENWHFGKWLLIASLFTAIAVQSPVFFAAALISVTSAGVVRIAQTTIQPMMLTITALTALFIPVLARDYSAGRWKHFTRRSVGLSGSLFGLAVLFEILLYGWRGVIDSWIYSGRMGDSVRVLPLWGGVTMILALTSGLQAGFQAVLQPRALAVAAAIWCLVSVGLEYALTLREGIWGLSLAVVLGYVIFAMSLLVRYLSWWRGSK